MTTKKPLDYPQRLYFFDLRQNFSNSGSINTGPIIGLITDFEITYMSPLRELSPDPLHHGFFALQRMPFYQVCLIIQRNHQRPLDYTAAGQAQPMVAQLLHRRRGITWIGLSLTISMVRRSALSPRMSYGLLRTRGVSCVVSRATVSTSMGASSSCILLFLARSW